MKNKPTVLIGYLLAEAEAKSGIDVISLVADMSPRSEAAGLRAGAAIYYKRSGNPQTGMKPKRSYIRKAAAVIPATVTTIVKRHGGGLKKGMRMQANGKYAFPKT